MKTKLLLAVLDIAVSTLFGAVQMAEFRKTKEAWRRIFSLLAFANAAGGVVVFVLLSLGYFAE